MKLSLALGALAIVAMPAAQAHTTLFSSPLAPEVAGATGSGTVNVEYDQDGHTLFIDTSFSGLTGTTTIAHIHCCVASPGTAGVAVTPTTLPGFPTGLNSGSYSVVLDLKLDATYTNTFRSNNGGTASSAESALIAGLTNGTAYFNIHTTRFTGGEIRGFLAPVPEPSSFALIGLGMLLLGLATRRKARR